MSSDNWQRVRLEDLVTITHGFAFPGAYIHDEPVGDLLLTPGNFAIGGGFRRESVKYYDGPVPEGFVLAQGDLMVTMTDLSKTSDTLGYPAILPAADGRRYLHNQRLGKIEIRSAGLDNRFLYYRMRARDYRDEVLASATGTTVKHTSPGRIGRFTFELPPIREQRAIAALLGALDDKIELNRRMNETLDALCRTLLTRVATGAATARLGDLVEINARKRDRTYPHDVIEYVEISAVNEGRIDSGSRHPTRIAPGRAQRLVRDGDTIWSCVRPNRRAYAFIDSPPDDLVVSTGFATLTPVRVPPAYLYFAATSDEFVDHLTANADGSAYPAVKPEHFAMGEIPLASDDEIGAFEVVARPALARSAHNERESRTLAALRDALLPKLISGELRIRDAERAGEQAT